MITPAQCRAARGYANLTLPELSGAAGVTATTISKWENGRSMHPNHIEAIERALVARGIVFEGDTVGMRPTIEDIVREAAPPEGTR